MAELFRLVNYYNLPRSMWHTVGYVQETSRFGTGDTLLERQEFGSTMGLVHSGLPLAVGRGHVALEAYSYGHLLVITGYKWDYTFYKWGYKYL